LWVFWKLSIIQKNRHEINSVVLCMDCGIVRSNQVPSKEEMNKFYSSNLYRFIYESSDLEEYLAKKIKLALSRKSLIVNSLEPYIKK